MASKQNPNMLLNFNRLFNSSLISKNPTKIISNTRQLKSLLVKSFPSLKSLQIDKIRHPKHADIVMRKYITVLHKNFNVLLSYSDIKNIFSQVYIYLTKTLVVSNVGLGGAAAVGSVVYFFSTFGVLIIPFALICTFAVLLNAASHGIPVPQAIANFKKSFREFWSRNTFTKKEKAFAYIPLFAVSVCLWLIKWAKGMTLTDLITKLPKSKELGKSLADEAGKDIAGKVTDFIKTKGSTIKVKNIVIFFTVALIIFLFLTWIDELVLRKGELSSEEV